MPPATAEEQAVPGTPEGAPTAAPTPAPEPTVQTGPSMGDVMEMMRTFGRLMETQAAANGKILEDLIR